MYLIKVNDIFNVLDEVNYFLFFITRLILLSCNLIFVFNHMPVLFSLFTSWFIDNHLPLTARKLILFCFHHQELIRLIV